jgi:hypothetical protein
MPLVQDARVVAAPDAGVSFSLTNRRLRVTGRYSYAYTSLGPRIGFGMRHRAMVRLLVRPLDGGRYRDLLLEGITRVSHGAAPLGEDALDADATGPPMSMASVLTTTALATGLKLDIPWTRGLALTTRLDVEYARGDVDHGPSATHLLGLMTVGLTGILSTDKRRAVRRDPEAETEEAGRAWGAPASDGRRYEDRSTDAAPSAPEVGGGGDGEN